MVATHRCAAAYHLCGICLDCTLHGIFKRNQHKMLSSHLKGRFRHTECQLKPCLSCPQGLYARQGRRTRKRVLQIPIEWWGIGFQFTTHFWLQRWKCVKPTFWLFRCHIGIKNVFRTCLPLSEALISIGSAFGYSNDRSILHQHASASVHYIKISLLRK